MYVPIFPFFRLRAPIGLFHFFIDFSAKLLSLVVGLLLCFDSWMGFFCFSCDLLLPGLSLRPFAMENEVSTLFRCYADGEDFEASFLLLTPALLPGGLGGICPESFR